MSAATPATTTRRWVANALLAAALIYIVFRDGVDGASLLSAGAIIALVVAGHYSETRLSRRSQSYVRLGMASVFIALPTVALPAVRGQFSGWGAIFWAGVTLLGLIWVIYYERTEPR